MRLFQLERCLAKSFFVPICKSKEDIYSCNSYRCTNIDEQYKALLNNDDICSLEQICDYAR